MVAVQTNEETLDRRSPNGDIAMKPESTVTDRILEAVAEESSCRVDDLAGHFPDLMWLQVFIEVNRLSLNGQLCLMSDDRGVSIVRRPGAVRAV